MDDGDELSAHLDAFRDLHASAGPGRGDAQPGVYTRVRSPREAELNLLQRDDARHEAPRSSCQRQERGFTVSHKRFDLPASRSKQVDDLVCRAIAQPNPDHFRWWAMQNAEPMKVFVLGHDHEATISCISPDRTIGSRSQADRVHMERLRVGVREHTDQACREILVEKQSRRLLRQPDYSRSDARARQQTPDKRGYRRA